MTVFRRYPIIFLRDSYSWAPQEDISVGYTAQLSNSHMKNHIGFSVLRRIEWRTAASRAFFWSHVTSNSKD